MAQYNDDFPIAFHVFARTLVGTPDEVWTRLLAQQSQGRKFSELGWRNFLEKVKKG